MNSRIQCCPKGIVRNNGKPKTYNEKNVIIHESCIPSELYRKYCLAAGTVLQILSFLAWKTITIHHDYKMRDYIKLNFIFIRQVHFCSAQLSFASLGFPMLDIAKPLVRTNHRSQFKTSKTDNLPLESYRSLVLG